MTVTDIASNGPKKAWITGRRLRERQLSSSRAELLVFGQVLAGSWRTEPEPLVLTEAELETLLPLLQDGGSAALAWRAVSRSAVADSAPARALRDAARILAVMDRIRDDQLALILAVLNAEAIVPLLFKGWAAARSYAHSYLRPYGDFDLLVRPHQLAQAKAALLRAGINVGASQHVRRDQYEADVDLHAQLNPFYATPNEPLFARAVPLRVGDGSVLVPCPEDHLRIVSLHFFKHGGWRPLWLCDIAAITEAVGSGFDWEQCLTTDPVARSWIEGGIAAARSLVGCRIDHLPMTVKAPRWLTECILSEWRRPYERRFAAPWRGLDRRYPAIWLKAHWPSPLLGAFRRGTALSSGPQWPHQMRWFLGVEVPIASQKLIGLLREPSIPALHE